MAQVSPVLRSIEGGYLFFCPGCKERHVVNVTGTKPGQGPRWSFNGDERKPTFQPSILVTWNEPSDKEEEFDDESKDRKMVCHSFVTEGKIQFLDDCTHSLAGQTVPLPII